MSKYRRDDKVFREQIAALADAGLTFPTAPATLSAQSPEIGPKGKLPEVVAGIVALLATVGAIWLVYEAAKGVTYLMGVL